MFRRLSSRLPSRKVLRNLLDEYPMIDAVFAQLLYERWFRVAFALLLLLLPASICLLWPVTRTPENFTPSVEASGLDLLQAWSLKRTALRAEGSGRLDDAVYAWRVAIAQNSANVSYIRSLLRLLRRTPGAEDHGRVAAAYGPWLLRLTRTNRADLELCLQIYDKHNLDALLISAFTGWEGDLTPSLIKPRLRALFEAHDFSGLAGVWQKHYLSIPASSKSEAELYYAAYLCGWQTSPENSWAAEKLTAAKSEPVLHERAHRLQLQVSARAADPGTYEESLNALARLGKDQFREHLVYWDLLIAAGHKNKAKRLVAEFAPRPPTAAEAMFASQLYYNLDLSELSLETLREALAIHPHDHDLWLSYSNLLMLSRHWDDLEKTALRMRNVGILSGEKLAAFSYYAQGVAALGQGRKLAAEQAFRQISAHPKETGNAIELARKTARLGFQDAARQILGELRSRPGHHASDWCSIAKAAFDLGEQELLLHALNRAHTVDPADLYIANNYAAALLATRQHSVAALEMTTRNLRLGPEHPSARINHSLALIQNRRFEEAAGALASLEPFVLEPGDSTAYFLAAFELAAANNDLHSARRFFARIELPFLLPSEIQWLNACLLSVESSAVRGI